MVVLPPWLGPETTITRSDYRNLLLPVWVNAFRYHGRTYRVLINAETGRVAGDRPYSRIKIFLLGLGIALFIAASYVFSIPDLRDEVLRRILDWLRFFAG